MWEILVWLFMSIVKFVVTPSLMVAAGYNCIFTVVVCTLGAFLGVVIFYNLGKRIFKWLSDINFGGDKKKKKVFTPTRRRFVELKNKYGYAGVLFTSVIISVPVASVLVAKYFRDKPAAMYMLGLVYFVWSVILTALSCAVA